MATVETRFTATGVAETQAACGSVAKGLSGVSDSAKGAASSLDHLHDHTTQAHMGMSKFEMGLMSVQMRLMNITMALALVAAVIVFPFMKGIEAVDSFQASVIKTAAMLSSLKTSGDVAENYKQAKVYAEGLQAALMKIDANTTLNLESLQNMNE